MLPTKKPLLSSASQGGRQTIVESPFFEDIDVGYRIPSLIKMPSTIQLFMFSAITWNRHRIHYDSDFARNHDKLPNILVQRPLLGCFLAQMLSEWLGENGEIKRLEWSAEARHVQAIS